MQANKKILLSVVKCHKLALYEYVTRMALCQKRSCNGQSTALEREVGKERLGLIILKTGQTSMFPHYCVLMRGDISGGRLAFKYPL
jgi:hypothetical protein